MLPGSAWKHGEGRKVGLNQHNVSGPHGSHERERSIQISRPWKDQEFLSLESVLMVKGRTNSILPVSWQTMARPRPSLRHLVHF